MPEHLTLLCWNVNYPRFAADNSYVLQTLESANEPDVICLQEYVKGKDDLLADWLKEHGYTQSYLPFAFNLDGLSQGVMTATKKHLNCKVQPLVLRKNGPRRFRPFNNVRGLLSARIRIAGQELVIANFHSTYVRPHVMDMRKQEFKELKSYLQSQSGKKLLLCGDFNFFGLDRRRSYLKSRFRHFTGSLLKPTWQHHARYSPLMLNLDYLFWHNLTVNASLLPKNTSDHRPIIATISIV